MLEKLEDKIAPVTELEFKLLELVTQNGEVSKERIICKREKNNEWRCISERGMKTFVVEGKPSCDDIMDTYENMNDNIPLYCEVNRVQRDFSKVGKMAIKIAMTAAVITHPEIVPIVEPITKIIL